MKHPRVNPKFLVFLKRALYNIVLCINVERAPITIGFVHTYWAREIEIPKQGEPTVKRKRSVPDLMGALGINAGVKLLREGEIDFLLIASGQKLDGHPLTEVMKEYALLNPQKPRIPSEKIIIDTTAFSTIGEIRALKKIAKEKRWKLGNIVDISIGPHRERVINGFQKLFGSQRREVSFKTSEEILGVNLEKFNCLPTIKNLQKWEKGLNPIAKAPLVWRILDSPPLFQKIT